MAECPIPDCAKVARVNNFMFWAEKEPPMGCADDEPALHGKPRTITHHTQCPYRMREARDQAAKRKAAPHCYDENGNLIPGMANEMWRCFAASHPQMDARSNGETGQ
jgi:hypothetical protein